MCSFHMFIRVSLVQRLVDAFSPSFSRFHQVSFFFFFVHERGREREKLKRINNRARRTGRQVRRGTFSRRGTLSCYRYAARISFDKEWRCNIRMCCIHGEEGQREGEREGQVNAWYHETKYIYEA